MVLNILACLNAGATTVAVRKNVVWSQFALIGSVMILGSVPAAFLIAAMDTAPLLILVGVALLIALAVVTFGKNLVPPVTGRAPALTAGVVADSPTPSLVSPGQCSRCTSPPRNGPNPTTLPPCSRCSCSAALFLSSSKRSLAPPPLRVSTGWCGQPGLSACSLALASAAHRRQDRPSGGPKVLTHRGRRRCCRGCYPRVDITLEAKTKTLLSLAAGDYPAPAPGCPSPPRRPRP